MIPHDPHLLVVDDDERLRALLQRYLSTHGYRVSAAPGAAEARELLANMEFDLLVLDVMMPGESGLDFARDLRRASSVPILMLTARVEPADRIAGLEQGADDYLAKPFEPRELLLRINSLLRRVQAPAPATAIQPVRMGAALFDPEGGRLTKSGKPVKLTSAEQALLQLFAAHAGRPFSRADLCKRLGVALERSIDVQVTRLRRKIEEDPKLPLYLQTVRGIGYMLVPDRQ
ncbi:MAG: response regulator [Alphaproteobacteria bacterium]|nr:response regulator [Alphaproteobacteria bacterium]